MNFKTSMRCYGHFPNFNSTRNLTIVHSQDHTTGSDHADAM